MSLEPDQSNVESRPIRQGGQYEWAATVIKAFSNGASRVAGLLVLQHFHVDTQTAWRSQKDLAADLGMSEKGVQRIIVDLTRAGYLSPRRKFGASYRYELTLPYPAAMRDMNPAPLRGMDASEPAAMRGMDGAETAPYPAASGGHTPQDCGLNSFHNSIQGDGLQPSPLGDTDLKLSDVAREPDPFEDELSATQIEFYRNLRRFDRLHYQRLTPDDRDGYQSLMESMDE